MLSYDSYGWSTQRLWASNRRCMPHLILGRLCQPLIQRFPYPRRYASHLLVYMQMTDEAFGPLDISSRALASRFIKGLRVLGLHCFSSALTWTFGKSWILHMQSRVPINLTGENGIVYATLSSLDVEELTVITPAQLKDAEEFDFPIEDDMKQAFGILKIVCFVKRYERDIFSGLGLRYSTVKAYK